MVAKPHNAFTLENVEITLLERPLFYIGEHYVTILGLIAFAGFFAAGLLITRFLRSQIVRRFFSRFKIDTRYRSDINFAIAAKFREAGIEMPFPQRDLHIRSGVLRVENVTETETAKGRESADVSSDLPSAG